MQCKFGPDCEFFKQGKCRYTIHKPLPCKFGNNCKFYASGTCNYSHDIPQPKMEPNCSPQCSLQCAIKCPLKTSVNIPLQISKTCNNDICSLQPSVHEQIQCKNLEPPPHKNHEHEHYKNHESRQYKNHESGQYKNHDSSQYENRDALQFVKPCKNGPTCRFLALGTCKYFHQNYNNNNDHPTYSQRVSS